MFCIFGFTEEVITKRVTDVTTTKNIETRVQREITLKDGVVIDDSGPIVETHTTEDVEKTESEQTEVRTILLFFLPTISTIFFCNSLAPQLGRS